MQPRPQGVAVLDGTRAERSYYMAPAAEGTELRLADHFPLVHKTCKKPAAKFFDCFSEKGNQPAEGVRAEGWPNSFAALGCCSRAHRIAPTSTNRQQQWWPSASYTCFTLSLIRAHVGTAVLIRNVCTCTLCGKVVRSAVQYKYNLVLYFRLVDWFAHSRSAYCCNPTRLVVMIDTQESMRKSDWCY